MDYRLSTQFDLWAGRLEVQQQARAFIAGRGEEVEKLLVKLEAPVPGNRMMNFRIIDAMNQLYWHCEKQLQLEGVAGRSDFNHMAMQPDPHWRKVIVIFAYALGFRFQAPTASVRA